MKNHLPPRASVSSVVKNRRGFTLVELLVVIVIIGILAGLVVAVAPPIIRRAHRMTITGEMNQLDMALQAYRQKYGDYPPDFAGVNFPVSGQYPARDAVIRHLRQAFPRYRPGVPSNTPTGTEWDKFTADLMASYSINPANLTPASALVFWLGGLPAGSSSSTKLTPFSANPANPFAVGGSRLKAFFEFDEARLVVDANNIYQFKPPHVKDPDGGEDAPPYVYFQARRDGYIQFSTLGTGDRENKSNCDPPYVSYCRSSNTQVGTCVPYAKSVRVDPSNSDVLIYEWFNPKTCQILCCGLDGIYGPTPANATSLASVAQIEVRCVGQDQKNLKGEEGDNLGNFAQGTLEDWHEGE